MQDEKENLTDTCRESEGKCRMTKQTQWTCTLKARENARAL